jgi:phosphonate transport system substrate-binding protein
MNPIIVGAVLYDPKVSIIWEIIRGFFEEKGVPLDVVYYTNYELQVKALLGGHLDIAWNSPLAWLEAQQGSGGTCRAIAMRDTDRDRRTHIVVGGEQGGKTTDEAIRSIGDLAGRTIAFGAQDSPQATLIPKEHLRRHGLPGDAYTALGFDVLVGKHGDHIGGEQEAFGALHRGEAAATCMLDLNWEAWTRDGTVDPNRFRILSTTEPFDHCVFTVTQRFTEEREKAFLQALFSMDYADPKHREMMDLEGLKEWLPGRVSGFGLLTGATGIRC